MSYVYLVKVQASIPYPWEREYRVEASNFSLALARGGKLFRKEERLRRKKITKVTASAERLMQTV